MITMALSYPPKIVIMGYDEYLQYLRNEDIDTEKINLIKYGESKTKNGKIKFKPTDEFVESLLDGGFISSLGYSDSTKIYLEYKDEDPEWRDDIIRYALCGETYSSQSLVNEFCDPTFYGQVYLDLLTNISKRQIYKISMKYQTDIIRRAFSSILDDTPYSTRLSGILDEVSNQIFKDDYLKQKYNHDFKTAIEDTYSDMQEVIKECKKKESDDPFSCVEEYRSMFDLTLQLSSYLKMEFFNDPEVVDYLCTNVLSKYAQSEIDEQVRREIYEYCGWW